MLRRLFAVLLVALLFFFGTRVSYAAMDFEEEGDFHYYIRDNINLFDQYDIGTAIPTFQSSNNNDYVVFSASGYEPGNYDNIVNTFTATKHPESYDLNTIIVDFGDGVLYPGLSPTNDTYSDLSVDIHSSSFLEKIDTNKTYLLDIVITPRVMSTGHSTYFLEPFDTLSVNYGGGSILAEEFYSKASFADISTYIAEEIHYRALVKFDDLSLFTFFLDGKNFDLYGAVYEDLYITVNFNLYEAIDNTQESTSDWLEKIYNALTGGGDTPATDPVLDGQLEAGQSALDQMESVESELVGDYQENVGAVAPESYALPSQALTGISWIGSIMTSVWNGLGDFQALITFPCIVALALVFIGRFSKLR